MKTNQKNYLKKIHHKVLLNHIEFVMDAILANSFGYLSFGRYKSEYDYTLILINHYKIKMPKELVRKSQKCQLMIIEIERENYVKNTMEILEKQMSEIEI